MKMREIIDMMSELYREEREKAENTRIELFSVDMNIKSVEFTSGRDISLHEYNDLIRERERLEESLKRRIGYYEGISRAREMLMDLGFDTEVER